MPLCGIGKLGGKDCCNAAIEEMDCSRCTDSKMSRWYQVEVSGIANGGCSSCGDLDGVYIIEMTNSDIPSGDFCTGSITFDTICGINTAKVQFAGRQVFGDPTLYEFRLSAADGTNLLRWQESVGYFESLDCLSFNEQLFDDSKFDSFGTNCDISGATCKVTAIPPP